MQATIGWLQKFADRSFNNKDQKISLAKYVCQQIIENAVIENVDSIFLGAGTTIYYVGKQLTKARKTNLGILTNNVGLIHYWLTDNSTIFETYKINVAKGELLAEDFSIANKKVKADICFISTSGFSGIDGITCYNPYTIHQEQGVIRYNSTIVVVADYYKIRSMLSYCVRSAGAIRRDIASKKGRKKRYILVTNADLPRERKNKIEEELERIRELGVSIIRVDMDGNEIGTKTNWRNLIR